MVPYPSFTIRSAECGSSYFRTLEAIRWANEAGLPIQINTCVSKRNLRDLDNMAALLKQFRIVLWSAFFLVPTGRGQTADLPTAQEFEDTFATLNRLAGQVPFRIKTTEAQHYRWFVVQNRHHRGSSCPAHFAGEGLEQGVPGFLPINDGKGFCLRLPQRRSFSQWISSYLL